MARSPMGTMRSFLPLALSHEQRAALAGEVVELKVGQLGPADARAVVARLGGEQAVDVLRSVIDGLVAKTRLRALAGGIS